MRNFLKKSIPLLSPKLFLAIQRRWGDAGAEYRIENALKSAGVSDTVGAGPFKGMRYVQQSTGSCLYAKTLGTYERELYPIIDEILNTAYPLVIDVGCAEGYYAVGLAVKMQATHVIAFDAQAIARQLCAQLAALNGCGNRVEIRGACDPVELSKVLRPHSLLVCDCEGYELELLNPTAVPSLAQTDILVELHDCFRAGLSEALLPRFQSTHSISVIHTQERRAGTCDLIRGLKSQDQEVAMFEQRPGPMSWAWMKAKLSD